jgi:hypothetical protein
VNSNVAYCCTQGAELLYRLSSNSSPDASRPCPPAVDEQHGLLHLIRLGSCGRRFLAGPSPRRPPLDPRPVHVTSEMDVVALGQFFLPVLQFSPVSIIPPMLHTHSFIYHRCHMDLAINSVINTSNFMLGALINKVTDVI